MSHAVIAHQSKGGDPTTDNYVVTGGFFDGVASTLGTGGRGYSVDENYVPAMAFDWYASGSQSLPVTQECPPLKSSMQPAVNNGMQVRRLTPVECARLQGVPDEHLNVIHNGKPLADVNKYRLLGNGFAIPVVNWIGRRIQMVEDMCG